VGVPPVQGERGAVRVRALAPGAALSLVRVMLIRVCNLDHFLSCAAVHAAALHPGARCVGIETPHFILTGIFSQVLCMIHVRCICVRHFIHILATHGCQHAGSSQLPGAAPSSARGPCGACTAAAALQLPADLQAG
jgi:hypothetical protein